MEVLELTDEQMDDICGGLFSWFSWSGVGSGGGGGGGGSW